MREEKLLEEEKALPDDALDEVAGGKFSLSQVVKKVSEKKDVIRQVVGSQNSNLAALGAKLKEKSKQ